MPWHMAGLILCKVLTSLGPCLIMFDTCGSSVIYIITCPSHCRCILRCCRLSPRKPGHHHMMISSFRYNESPEGSQPTQHQLRDSESTSLHCNTLRTNPSQDQQNTCQVSSVRKSVAACMSHGQNRVIWRHPESFDGASESVSVGLYDSRVRRQ
jgi:hypothetical protein